MKAVTLKKRKLKRKPLWYLYTTVIVIIVFFTFFSFSKSIYKIWRLSRLKQSEEKVLDNAIEEKKRLEKEIEQLTSDSLYIEEIASEEYGMTKKGEEVFYITFPDSSGKGKNDDD